LACLFKVGEDGERVGAPFEEFVRAFLLCVGVGMGGIVSLWLRHGVIEEWSEL